MPQLKCVDLLISGKFEDAVKEALAIYQKHPRFLLISSYFDVRKSRSLLLKFIEQDDNLDPHFLILLLDDLHNFNEEAQSEIVKLCQNAIKRNSQPNGSNHFISYRLKAELIFHKVVHPSESDLADLIKHLNDFRLYSYANNYNMHVSPNDTINFKWYLAHRGDVQMARNLILKSTSFNDILQLSKLLGDSSVGNAVDILIEFLTHNCTPDRISEMIKMMIQICQESSSFLNVKILLSLLISTRSINNLVLAAYIAHNNRLEANYEILLIEMFIYRYFCFIPIILKLYKFLDIKNVQLYNTAYIWSDPLIYEVNHKCKINLHEVNYRIKEIQSIQKSDLALIRERIVSYVDYNRIAHAVSLVELHRMISDSITIKELEAMKIMATKKQTIFTDLLGSKCSYLFDKLVCNCNIQQFHIFKSIDQLNEAFINEFLIIDDKFKVEFINAWKEI